MHRAGLSRISAPRTSAPRTSAPRTSALSYLVVLCLSLALAAPAAAQGPSITSTLSPAPHPALPALALAPPPALPYAHAVTATALQAAASSEDIAFPACPEVGAPVESGDTTWQWRLRAYRQLDCVRTIVDAALDTPARAADGEDAGDRVTLSREDLERIRLLAWWARDAAARIGR